MTTPFNYSYATNSDGILVNIKHANHKEMYYCPTCGTQMTPHLGKIRRWHFVHKNIVNCSYESYLHNLAKIRIHEAFIHSEHFMLAYDSSAICSLSCPYKNSPKCIGEKPVKFDLHRFYDRCDIEAPYHNFRADLLLSSSSNPSRPPILIEIKVTHECTKEKIDFGARIIEIPIYSESQIDEIVNSCSFSGVRSNSESHFNYYSKREPQYITLYNFNKIEQFNPRENIEKWYDILYHNNSFVFILDGNGKFRTFECNCFDIESKIPKDVHYFISNNATPFKEIFQYFSRQGVKVRTCFLCKFSKKDFYNERICVLYKKFGLSRKPSPNTALTCSHFQEDVDYNSNLITSQLSQLDEANVSNGHKSYIHICKDIL